MNIKTTPVPVQFGTVKPDKTTCVRSPLASIGDKEVVALHERRRLARVEILNRLVPSVATKQHTPGVIHASITLHLHMADYRYHLRVNGKVWSHQDPRTCVGWDTLEAAVQFLNKEFLTD